MTKISDTLINLERSQEFQNEKLMDILNEVKKTNGRVTTLEQWKQRLHGVWLAGVILGSIIATGSGIVFVVLEFLK